MLFHVKQAHEPKDCPYGKGGSPALVDRSAPGVTVHGSWLAFPQHTVYYILETDEIGGLQGFLKPGTGVTTAEITPVSDRPAD